MNLSSNSDIMNRFYDRFDQIHTYLSLTLCVFGLVANIFTAVILTRPNMVSVVNRLLTVVAVCDSCLLSSYILYIVHYKFLIRIECPADQMTFGWAVFALIHANASIFLRAVSLWLSVIIAAYRKRLLYSYQPPGYAEDYCKVYKLILVTVFLVGIASVPIVVGNSIREEMIPVTEMCDNSTEKFYRVVQSTLSPNLLNINHFVNAVLFKLSPCALLAYYLLSIINLLYNQKQLRHGLLSTTNISTNEGYGGCWSAVRPWSTRRSTGSRCSSCRASCQQFNPTTILLSTILLMTILCELPNAVASALSGVLPNKFFTEVYRNLGDVFDVLSLFNGLTTFIMYCSMSQLFRLTFFGIFFSVPSLTLMYNRTFRNGNYVKELDDEFVDSTFSNNRTANVSRKGTKDYCLSPIDETKFVLNVQSEISDNIQPFQV